MEVVTLAGLAVVAVGGYYSALDFMADLGIRVKKVRTETRKSTYSSSCILTSQRRIKKVAGMHV
jgi:hypothetical protein